MSLNQHTRQVESATNNADTNISITLGGVQTFISSYLDEEAATFDDATFIRISAEGRGISASAIASPLMEDCTISGRYYEQSTESWRARLKVPSESQYSGHCTTFLKESSNLEEMASPRYISVHSDESFWRIDGDVVSLAAMVQTALEAGHPVAVSVSLLRTVFGVGEESGSEAVPESGSPGSSETGCEPVKVGHGSGGGVTDVEGEYMCPAEDCSYHGEFKRVRSHIGGKLAYGGDGSHSELGFSI